MNTLRFSTPTEFSASLELPDGIATAHLSRGGKFIVGNGTFRVDLSKPGGELVALPADGLWRRFCELWRDLFGGTAAAEARRRLYESVRKSFVVTANGVESSDFIPTEEPRNRATMNELLSTNRRQRPRTVDWRYAVLSGRELSLCDFTALNLSWADLTNSALHHARFTGSCLSRAKLDGATLSDVSFRGADLRKACLRNVQLLGACDFSGAKLDGARIEIATAQLSNLADFRTLAALVLVVRTIGDYPDIRDSLVGQICDGLLRCGRPLSDFARGLLTRDRLFQGKPCAQRVLDAVASCDVPGDSNIGAQRRLAVPANPRKQDIEQAYRQAALQCHPDKGGTKEAFTALKAERDAWIAKLA